MTNPGHYTTRVGDAHVTALYDGSLQAPPDAILLGIAPEDAEAMVHARFRGPGLQLHVNAYLVRTAGRTILIDTGAGTFMGPGCGRLPASLAAAGIEPGSVDTVLLTHLHGDHIGGLLTPEGAAAFPHATLAASAGEIAFWLDPANETAAPEPVRSAIAAVRTALAPYGNGLQTLAEEAAPGIACVPLPGHTPGHTGFLIGTGPGALLIWGDVMHVPDIQAPRPEIGVGFDSDPALARQSREAILARAATERLRIAGMHLHFPGFCHVAPAGPAYALVPDMWQETA